MNVHLEDHPRYGDASDGNVTLGSNTTLTRNMQYNVLDLAGFTLNAAGFLVMCQELKNTGGAAAIHNAGGNGSGSTQGSAGAAGFLGGGGAGGAGGQNNANGGSPSGVTDSWPALSGGSVGVGGTGGNSGSGRSGGTPGSVTAPAATKGYPSGPYWTDHGRTPDAGILRGGSGGSGGGAAAGVGCAGGGGGGGGGVVKVNARIIGAGASSITIHADGGNGGNAALGPGTGSGGGGGGGGGGASLVYQQIRPGSALPTLRAAGGAKGNLAGAGSDGAAGNAGVTETRKIVGGYTVAAFRQEPQPWNAIALVCEIVVNGAGVTGLTVAGTLRRRSDGQWLQSGGGWGASPSSLSLTAVDAANLAGVYRYTVDPDDLSPDDEGYLAKITESTYSLVEHVLITPTGTADESRQTYALRQGYVRVVATDHDPDSGQPTEGTVWTYPDAAAVAADTTPDGTGSIGTYEYDASYTDGKLGEYASRRTS